jgi:hypothetical protein
MKALIDVQIIRQEGRPVFAVLPYDQYLALAGQHDDSDVYIPMRSSAVCREGHESACRMAHAQRAQSK